MAGEEAYNVHSFLRSILPLSKIVWVCEEIWTNEIHTFSTKELFSLNSSFALLSLTNMSRCQCLRRPMTTTTLKLKICECVPAQICVRAMHSSICIKWKFDTVFIRNLHYGHECEKLRDYLCMLFITRSQIIFDLVISLTFFFGCWFIFVLDFTVHFSNSLVYKYIPSAHREEMFKFFTIPKFFFKL